MERPTPSAKYTQLLFSLAKHFALEAEGMFAAETDPEAALRGALREKIYSLLKDDYGLLLNILYRIDLREQVLKQCLSESSLESAAACLADAVMRRQAEKAGWQDKMQGKKE